MPHYPLFLDLANCRCLLAGAGDVGYRKLNTLITYGAKDVLVLDPAPPSTALQELLLTAQKTSLEKNEGIRFEQRPACIDDLKNKDLVFAATGNSMLNTHLAQACREKHILCNCIDAPEEGNVIIPASIQKENLVLTLSTGGSSPALAKKWRQELEEWTAKKVPVSIFMRRLRPLVLHMVPEHTERTKLFRAVAHSQLEHLLTQKDAIQASLLLQELLPRALHASIEELLHDLV